MMDFVKKNWWWILALALGAVGAYLAFMPSEKEQQLARARAAKAAKAAERDTVDVDHEEIVDLKAEAGGTN